MPIRGYRPSEGKFEILECKNCGMMVKIMPGQRKILKTRCRNCGKTRFRTVKE